MTKLHSISEIGQAIWLDYIRRSFISSGDLEDLVKKGLRGVTSNPSIFRKAIAGSADYDEQLVTLVEAGKSVDEIYTSLVLEDIQSGADVLRPVYEETGGKDGYISLEVSPDLAYDTQGTIEEARQFFQALNRPNVMIKVPATPEGIHAIERLISEGINVNVTLIFSISQYESVAQAYLKGLEKLATNGGDVSQIASVESFFISRVDVAIDEQLRELSQALNDSRSSSALSLQGKIGIANAKLAYQRFKQIFTTERWEKLDANGARLQRPLWASTSTKNPTYSETYYVDNLIGPNTVNTLPPSTLRAFQNHGTIALTIDEGLDQAHAQLTQLKELGVDLDQVTQKLQDEGVASFAESFEALKKAIADKCAQLQTGWKHISTNLGKYQDTVDQALEEVESKDILSRIWSHDHTVWKPEPKEISNRLNWLHTTEVMRKNLSRLQKLSKSITEEGYTQVILLGMGGSSLAPEVFSHIFTETASSINLIVLDSTDPKAILNIKEQINYAKTIFIVATKSGTTVETLSLFKYFYNQVAASLGDEKAGEHFIAITDPGSKLVDLAAKYGFRDIYLNDPNIGGRYSALSYFGLVPASLVGVDIERLLNGAEQVTNNCESCNPAVTGNNYGALLGTIIGVLGKSGRDKLTFIISPTIVKFGDWLEQLIAESTGKEGKGILPVVGEDIGSPSVYGDDRLFVYLKMEGDDSLETSVNTIEESGHPVIRIQIQDLYDIGGQFFLWEMATAVAGYHLGINPFNQPNVEAAKVLAREMVSKYVQNGSLPEAKFASLTGQVLSKFLQKHEHGAYIAIQAYLTPEPKIDQTLQGLRIKLRDQTQMATTKGYGPRYLHSTGQLHKGDSGKGLFIQFISQISKDVPIPDEVGSTHSSITFGTLRNAQALGDAQALISEGRQVLRFNLGSDPIGEIEKLIKAL